MLDPATQQEINVTYTNVTARSPDENDSDGGPGADGRRKDRRVHVKVAGWINKVYLDYVGKLVKKGQPLFTLYSPDLVSTEQEYLIALKGQKYLSKTPYSDVSAGANSLLSATTRPSPLVRHHRCPDS